MQQHINISQSNTDTLQPPLLHHGLSSLDQNGHHHHYFESIKNKWNTNQEIAEILYAAQADPNSQCIANHILPRPTSGTQFIFPRYDGSWFKNDEFIWRRRKEGKLVREDHMKLKHGEKNRTADRSKTLTSKLLCGMKMWAEMLTVNKQQLISANYVHSAIVPSFHRRTYWLTQIPGFVLVHYLNESNMDKGTRKTAESIAECMKTNNVQISHAQLFDQLTPIYAHCLKPDEVHMLANAVFDVLRIENQQDPQNPQTPVSTTETKQFQLERRNSCSSAFRKGLSSIALRRQPSANSEIDASYIGTMMKKYGCCESPTEKMNLCVCGPSTSSLNRPNSNSTAVESRSPSGETERRSSNLDEDMSIYQQNSIKSSTNGTSPGMDASRGVMTSSISSTNNNNNHNSISSPNTISLTPIVDISPSSALVKGGEKILVIGAWYMKGHQYKVLFGSSRMEKATLVQAGVLSVIVPPGLKAETVPLQVFCNDQPVSAIRSFVYEKSIRSIFAEEESNKKNDDVAQQIFEKVRILAYALNAYSVIENLTSFVCDELSLVSLVHQIDQHFASSPNPVIHHPLLTGTPHFPVKTILHLTAFLDFDSLFDSFIVLSRKLPYFREFDVVSRDSEGCTPLHIASQNGSSRVAKYIISMNQSAVDVIDDRGRTPSDYANDYRIAAAIEDKNLDDDFERHVNATELWVLTNGETVTREHLLLSKLTKDEANEERNKDMASSCSMMSDFGGGDISRRALFQGTSREYDDDCDSCCDDDDDVDSNNRQLHVEISMDTDVHVPDSPKMARLFHVVTSPGVMITDNARAKMADLARQIIDALPDRIKRTTEMVGSLFDEDDQHHHAFTTRHNPMLSQNNVSCGTSMDSTCHVVDELYEMMVVDPHTHNHHSQMSHSISEPRSAETVGTGRSANLFASSHDERSFASCSTRANTFESDTLDFDKDLGEFFTINVDSRIDPIQQRLANLKYNDDEQREVYEAAMVIQRAYREYRARNTSRRQEDIERRAALKIQGCYRRYKQFCYFKKLHNAAIVVQKHFRMRKKDDKEEGVGEDVISSVPEHPTLDGQSIRIQVPQTNSSLLREHRAATTIQLAYRGHRKRQAAARKIQNFMRQSRNKLRRMHAQNEDGTLSVQDQNRIPEQHHHVVVSSTKNQSDVHNPIQQQQQQHQQLLQQQLIRRENSLQQTGICCQMTGSSAQQQPQQQLNLDHARIINGTN